jgi:hypothetical protein
MKYQTHGWSKIEAAMEKAENHILKLSLRKRILRALLKEK